MGLNQKMRKSGHLVTIIQGDGAPMVALDIRRNDPCPCGSGKKAKHCCGTETKYYSTRPREDE